MKRLIISDLHLGSYYAKEAQLIQFFEENSDFDELILAGDIIDFIRVPYFTEQTAKLFNFVSNFPERWFISLEIMIYLLKTVLGTICLVFISKMSMNLLKTGRNLE
jgi:predicted phosphodiesterase